jgi:hypothetical protein
VLATAVLSVESVIFSSADICRRKNTGSNSAARVKAVRFILSGEVFKALHNI